MLSAFLPASLLAYFEVVNFKKELEKGSSLDCYKIYLDEQNNLPEGHSRDDYESKGFLPSTKIQDFPIRGKAVYLLIRRRRWRHKETRKEITNDYSFLTEGSKLTKELSDFLKDTGRVPRRYAK